MQRTVFAALCLGVCLSLAAPAFALEQRFTNSIGMEFVLIPAGSFMMGCDDLYGNSCYANEKPRHRVTITKPFYMGTTEVTQAQWESVMGSKWRSHSHFKGADLPMECVSWNHVQEFIGKLNAQEGHERYRLPTEAEWEYAARAGSAAKYSFGDDAGQLDRYAWYFGKSGGRSHPVAQKLPNAWGLYDMHGNVWEWVWDWYDKEYYDWGPDTDPQGLEEGWWHRGKRGGAWNSKAEQCRSAYRSGSGPDYFDGITGFRLAMTAE